MRFSILHPVKPAPTPPNIMDIPPAPPKYANKVPMESAAVPSIPPAAPMDASDATTAGAASPPVTNKTPPPTAAAAVTDNARDADMFRKVPEIHPTTDPSSEAPVCGLCAVVCVDGDMDGDDASAPRSAPRSAPGSAPGSAPRWLRRMDLRCNARESSSAAIRLQRTPADDAKRLNAAAHLASYLLAATAAVINAPMTSVHRSRSRPASEFVSVYRVLVSDASFVG